MLRATWRGAWPDNKEAVAAFPPPTLFVQLHEEGRLINAVNFTRFMAIMQMTEPGKGRASLNWLWFAFVVRARLNE